MFLIVFFFKSNKNIVNFAVLVAAVLFLVVALALAGVVVVVLAFVVGRDKEETFHNTYL